VLFKRRLKKLGGLRRGLFPAAAGPNTQPVKASGMIWRKSQGIVEAPLGGLRFTGFELDGTKLRKPSAELPLRSV